MKIKHPQRAGAATQLLHSRTPESTSTPVLGRDRSGHNPRAGCHPWPCAPFGHHQLSYGTFITESRQRKGSKVGLTFNPLNNNRNNYLLTLNPKNLTTPCCQGFSGTQMEECHMHGVPHTHRHKLNLLRIQPLNTVSGQ